MAACLLVLTDFTAAADQALIYADTLAAPLGASLVLLHVRRESVLDPDALSGLIQHLSEGEVAAALATRTEPLNSPVTVEMAVNNVAEAVQQAVAQFQPLLVVLGKPDTEAIPDELVTSTSLTLLLRATSVPLLVVPLNTRAAPPTRATLAADGQRFQLQPAAIETVNHLLTGLQIRLTVAYVAEPEDSDDCSAALETVLDSGLGTLYPATRTHGVRHRHPAPGVLQAATETQAELLLLVARQRSLLGQLFHHSVSAQVILHSPVPVLLLPATE